MQVEAVKDANGLPPNIVAPRSRWIGLRTQVSAASPGRWYVTVLRQKYADVAGSFAGGAFVHGWWSWYIGIELGHHLIQVWRWRERWAK